MELAPFSKHFEEAVGEACESASARRVAKQFGLPESTVRAIDLGYLERWNAQRTKPALRQMGVDEIYLGKTTKFVTVVSNLEIGEPMWFGRERKKETLDEFFRDAVEPAAAATDGSGLRGHVGALQGQHPRVVAELRHRLRQVPYHAARQPGGG